MMLFYAEVPEAGGDFMTVLILLNNAIPDFQNVFLYLILWSRMVNNMLHACLRVENPFSGRCKVQETEEPETVGPVRPLPVVNVDNCANASSLCLAHVLRYVRYPWSWE